MHTNHPFLTIKQSLQYHPSIFPNVFRVLEHIFLTNGNGYEVDHEGNLAATPPDREEPCITDDGLRWLAFDMLKCDLFTVYPINSFEYEDKHKLSPTRFYTDFYAYPAMNADWQRAARWFLHQLLSRNANWWRRHYQALDANPAVESHGGFYKQYYARMITARKHLASFAKKQGIKTDPVEAMEWETELLAFLNPDLRRKSA